MDAAAALYIRKLVEDGLSLDQILAACHEQQEHACLKHTTVLVLSQLLPPSVVDDSSMLTSRTAGHEMSNHLGSSQLGGIQHPVFMPSDPVSSSLPLNQTANQLLLRSLANSSAPAQLTASTLLPAGTVQNNLHSQPGEPLPDFAAPHPLAPDSLTAIQLPLVHANHPLPNPLLTSLHFNMQGSFREDTSSSLPAMPTSLSFGTLPPGPVNPNVSSGHLPTMSTMSMLNPDPRHQSAVANSYPGLDSLLASMPSMIPLEAYGVDAAAHNAAIPALATSLASTIPTESGMSDQSATMAAVSVALDGPLPTGLAPSRLNAPSYDSLSHN